MSNYKPSDYSLGKVMDEISLPDISHPYSNDHATQHKNGSSVFFPDDVSRMIEADKIENLTAENGDNNIEWIWEGYIAKGLKTEISAYWKAGKTTLLVQLIIAILNGKPLAGKETNSAKIYFISEESKIIWIKRRDEKNLSGFSIKCKPFQRKLTRHEWEEYLKQLGEKCAENKFDLVIFDTISDFWPVNKENDSIEVKDALRPLNYLTENNIAVLIVHHFSRSGVREGGAGRGSSALPADVDIIIDFVRYDPNNDLDTRRVLKGGNSRFEETPREVVIQLTEGEYTPLGTKGEVEKEENLTELLAIVPFEPEKITVPQILEEIGKEISKSTISRHLNQLEKEGKVTRIKGKGQTLDLWSRASDSELDNDLRVALQGATYTNATETNHQNTTQEIPYEIGFDEKEDSSL